jgi:nucleotide-binding universal stress UspA family protein
MEQSAKSPPRSVRPFKRVLVGVDDQQGGQDAIALAAQLVGTGGSTILVTVRVQDPLAGRPSAADLQAVARSRSIGPEVPAHNGAGHLVHIDATSVGRGLHEVTDSEQADLLVIGSCRRGLLGRVMIGDDTNDALNGASCAVAIAPFAYAKHPAALSEIGVAYNGSAESGTALLVARALAGQHDAKVSAFTAVAVPASVALPAAGAVAQALPGLIEEARARITSLGDVEPHAAYGVPAEELALYSASLGLLVVGSRGYGPFGRLVHGSTSRQLGRTARCPLLVLPRTASDPTRQHPEHLGHNVAMAAT